MTLAPGVTLEQLAARYSTFFIDQFGVLRDDRAAYPGANDGLLFLKSLGKTIIILSNSGRSGDYNAERFVRLGFARAGFDRFLTSGDVAYEILKREASDVGRPRRCLTISSADDHDLSDRLGYENVEDASIADLIIISGSQGETIPMELYEERLRPAAARGVPCYCTNPDRHKLANGATVAGAGRIALAYQKLGGTIRWFGKPHSAIYEHALTLASPQVASDVVCVGDSIEHDIAGARQAGLASCLVRTGILAGMPAPDLAALSDRFSALPDYLMASFRRR
ncbi:MAG: TIGR01459 family HAD-type hydrolase [Rhizobium sp.]|nr:TIGR01459 family HAD-type hydrolase [Rhizobium sp.]